MTISPIHNDYTTNSQCPTIAIPSTHNGYTTNSQQIYPNSQQILTMTLNWCCIDELMFAVLMNWCLLTYWLMYWWIDVCWLVVWCLLYELTCICIPYLNMWLMIEVGCLFSWNFVFLYFVVNNPLCCLSWYQKYLIYVFFSPKYYFFSPKNS